MKTLAFLGVFLACLPAFAWNVFGDDCQGLNPLHWKQLPIPIYLSQEGTTDVPFSQLEMALGQSLQAWESDPSSYVAFDYRGTTDRYPRIAVEGRDLKGDTLFGKWDRPINVISFQTDDWPEELHGARGITFALSHHCDGTLIQSDIIMNDTHLDWHTTEMPSGCETCFDIQNMLTHELGHLLGIAHTDVPEATMNICDQVGSSVNDCWCNRATFTCGRTLEDDDLQAATYLYPLEAEPPHSDFAGNVGEGCSHPGQCADERCVVENGDGICTHACNPDDATTCPVGFICVTPTAEENPNGVSVCWFGEEGLGSPCIPNGCQSGVCIDGKCSEKCTPGATACPGNYQCEASGRGFYCLPPQREEPPSAKTPNHNAGGCQQLPPNLALLFLLGLGWVRKIRR